MRYILILTILFLFSCNDNKHVRKYKLPKINTTRVLEESLKQSSSISTGLPFSWDAPSDWIVEEGSSMRIGSYKVPYSKGLGDLSITYFQGDGGGLLANINRWRQQLNLEPASLQEIQESAIYGRSSIGEFKVFKIINYKDTSTAFLCSILTSESSTIFLKLSVPIEGIEELEDQFKSFVSTFRYNN